MADVVPAGGIATFLFTDIEGSTSRWETDPRAMSEALERHDKISAAAVGAAGGHVFKMTGDGMCAVFSEPGAALEAAARISRDLDAETWPEAIAPIRVRAGVHSGQAELRDDDYFGPTLNRVARLMAAGNGGQVLVSGTTRELVGGSGPDLVDLGSHRLRDLLRPEHIYSLAGTAAPGASLRVLDSSNLPVQATPFLGREGDLHRLSELVPAHRLVTLTGPGGAGKTRLALQAAAELSDDFSGVYFVSLAAVRDTDDVGRSLAAAVGVKETGPQGIDYRIAEALAAGPNLVILDNFEHVIGAAPFVGRLLEQAESLHVIVTSRELLRLRAERHYPVEPMEVPEVSDIDPAVLASYESVRLFVERATAVDSTFALDNTNANAVATICRRLDGLPLAIELAAARIRLFDPPHLLTALERGIGVLSRGPVDAPERHRALLDTIRWSYDLLGSEERALFARLSVFVAGMPLDAVEQVCMVGLEAQAIDLVEALADKSLVRTTSTRSGVKLDMLETIHEFAAARFEDDPEGDEIRRRHAGYYVALVEEADPHLRGRDQLLWIARLSDAAANIEAAMSWALDGGEPRYGLRLVAGLRDFWFYQGMIPEMAGWVQRAMEHLPGEDDATLRALVLLARGFDLYARQDPAAIEVLDEAVRLFETAGPPRLYALATIWSGGAREIIVEEYDEARVVISRGLALARAAGDEPLEGQALNMLGEMERAFGDYEEARRIQTEALEVSRRSGEVLRVAMVLANLGVIAHHLGDDDQAESFLRESLEVSLDQAFDIQVAHALFALSEQIAIGGDPARAARIMAAAERHFTRTGFMPQPADAPDYARIRSEIAARLDPAEFAAAAEEGSQLGLADAVALARSE